MNTGERLKYLREKNKLSQGDVARLLHVTTSLISAYERGERTPSPVKLSSLADLYHTSTDYLLCRNNNYNHDTFISVDGLTTKQIKLLRDLIDTMRT